MTARTHAYNIVSPLSCCVTHRYKDHESPYIFRDHRVDSTDHR